MITKSEIDNKIAEFEINPADVEKDYVYGHILKAIYADSPLAGHLILKGGNALRKAYLPNTRFSKDLDFSTSGRLDPSFLKEELNRICLDVESRTGIAFDTSKTLVKGKNLPIPNVEALEARAYFKGFYGEEKILLKAQLDVTEFDKIFLPVQSRDLIHPYPDAASCTATVQCQKIEEILASKLNTLLHRRKAIDLFDLLYSILFAQEFPVVRREVISTFLKKSVFDSEPSAAKSQLLAIPLLDFRSLWKTIMAPVKSLFDFDYVTSNFHALVDGLFSLVAQPVPAFASPVSAGLGGFRERIRPGYSPSFPPSYFPSGARNTILNAGQSQTLVTLQYEGIRRNVEPYKFEYKVRKFDGRGLEYLWAYDSVGAGRSGKPGIKSFICDKIESVQSTAIPFLPHFEVEL